MADSRDDDELTVTPAPRPLAARHHVLVAAGGVDNGVWASAWAELADLDVADVAPVLRLLADADVGGYVGKPGRPLVCRRRVARG